jgi:hypothetical protein
VLYASEHPRLMNPRHSAERGHDDLRTQTVRITRN